MKTAAVFLIDDFEETEGLTTVDILRRGKVEVTTVSLTGKLEVKGKHNIIVKADELFDDAIKREFDMLIIPGGTTDHAQHRGLINLVQEYNAKGKPIAAICAAPAVLGAAGIIKGKKAVCYPGMEFYLEGAFIGENNIEIDGNIITAKGPAITPFFALKLLEILRGGLIAEEVGQGFLIPLIK